MSNRRLLARDGATWLCPRSILGLARWRRERRLVVNLRRPLTTTFEAFSSLRPRAGPRPSLLAQSGPAKSRLRRRDRLEARHVAFEATSCPRPHIEPRREMSSPTPRALVTFTANGVTESSPVQPQTKRNRFDLLTHRSIQSKSPLFRPKSCGIFCSFCQRFT